MSEFEATRPGFGFEKPAEGETNDWLTPPALVAKLGEFALDPCASKITELAWENYKLPQDGLALPWHGKVWCNPPYGPHVGKWVDRMAEHRNGILLIFSRCETKAWEKVWSTGDAFLFPFGRVYFLRPDGTRAKSGTAPSALIAYGEECANALRECGIQGAYFRRAVVLNGVRITTL